MMAESFLAVMTTTGKAIISAEAVLVAALLCVLFVLLIRVRRDKKSNYTYNMQVIDFSRKKDGESEDKKIGAECPNGGGAGNEPSGGSGEAAKIETVTADVKPRAAVSAESARTTAETKTDAKNRKTEMDFREAEDTAADDINRTPGLDEVFAKDAEPAENDDADIGDDAEESTKINFLSKMKQTGVGNKAIYNALKNEIMSFRNVKSRVTNGGDYFRYPGKQFAKIVLIGKTLRLAIALDPASYDYNIYHQKDRGDMIKYADTPMFVKVQSRLGVQRARKLIYDCMTQHGMVKAKKYVFADYARELCFSPARSEASSEAFEENTEKE